MKLSRIFIINLIFIAGIFALSIWTWGQLPAETQVPVHFNLTGSPDRYIGKVGLFLIPAIALVTALLNPILPKIEPNKPNLELSSRAYAAFAIAITIFFSLVQVVIVLSALEKDINPTRIIITALGVFFIIAGNYLSKIRRNFFFGFRTSWTLSSDLAWHKTHRWASWLMISHGCAFVVAGLSSSAMLLAITLVSFAVLSIVVLPIYSYLLWKSDSNHLTE